ncbi:hypothetical protein Tco_0265911 [Tanacetum coccineum]
MLSLVIRCILRNEADLNLVEGAAGKERSVRVWIWSTLILLIRDCMTRLVLPMEINAVNKRFMLPWKVSVANSREVLKDDISLATYYGGVMAMQQDVEDFIVLMKFQQVKENLKLRGKIKDCFIHGRSDLKMKIG